MSYKTTHATTRLGQKGATMSESTRYNLFDFAAAGAASISWLRDPIGERLLLGRRRGAALQPYFKGQTHIARWPGAGP
jgi:hypothetical protein